MATGPKVQTLAESMAALGPGYEEQQSLYGEQIEGLGGQFDSQRQRLEGQRVQTFEDINNAATGRGVGAAFSGVPINEQNRYLANEFLPGQQALVEQENAQRMDLRMSQAELSTEQRTTALSRIDQQQQSLNQWNLQQAQLEAQRREAELQRRFTRSERIAGQEFKARQNAADRAAQSQDRGLTTSEARSTLLGLMSGGDRRGGDGYVSPDAYRRLSSRAYAEGIDENSYASLMQEFINPRHADDYTIS